MKKNKYKLCYVQNNKAFFTTQNLEDQWGDDWDDIPYEHNSGYPYEPCWHNEPGCINRKYRGNARPGELCKCDACKEDWDDQGNPKFKIKKVFFDSHWLLKEPCTGHANSPYSVEDINIEKKVPWLENNDGIKLYAGSSFKEFCDYIECLCDGDVYTKRYEEIESRNG